MLSFLESNKDISPYSAYKTKAVAKYFFRVKNVEDVSKIGEILSFAQEENLPILFLGFGTNCLFAFDEYRGIIIHNELLGYSIEEEDSGVFLRVSSGELVHPMVSRIYEQVQNTTLVPWSGLPGTFGGAII